MKIDKWNDKMFVKHSTPYDGLAGVVEKYRIHKVREYAKLKPTDKILEIGCEAGNLLSSLKGAKSRVGFDISRKALAQAQIKAEELGIKIRWVQGDATRKLPFRRGQFSVIVCSETLEHVLNPEKVVANIASLSNMDTRVIMTVPNERPKLLVKKLLSRLGIFRWILPGIESRQSEWHLHAFTHELLKKLVRKHFKIIKAGNILGLHEIVELRLRTRN